MSTDVIETAGLGKRYGSTWALRECSLAIPAGHVTALVGPNGAGKTTLLNLAVGLADPSAGSVTVLDGRPAGSPAALDGIAFVAQDMPVYKNLSAGDMLHLTANLNRRRELETGTFRYAWTQGIGRLRWTVGKLVPLAVAVTAVAGAFTVLFAWYNQPWVAAGYVTPFSARVFDLLGVAFAAWTLAAFAIGVLAGMLIRRAVPAIAATLAVYAALAFATGLWLREHYITPLATSSPNPPGSAWAISGWYTKGGTFAFGDHGNGIASTARLLCGGPCSGSSGSLEQILARHGYTHWISYQPGSRFWPFQWIEDGWLLALSVLLIAATVWLVRRRAA